MWSNGIWEGMVAHKELSMNEQEVIARQAVKLERLEAENAHLKDSIARARLHIICIGGPLNDNKLAYSKEQLYTFHRIKEELDA